MKFNEYQDASQRTAEGIAVPKPTSEYDKKIKLLYFVTAINGEVGELSEKVKKNVREGDPTYLEEAYAELGDVLWYWTQMCTLMDYEADQVAQHNLDKLLDRDERDEIFGDGDER